jgi:putative zinc finger protein
VDYRERVQEGETLLSESAGHESEILISCLEMFQLISDYIDDGVDPSLRRRMTAHFEHCHHCTAILDGTRNVLQLVGDERTFEVPAALGKKLYGKLEDYLNSSR